MRQKRLKALKQAKVRLEHIRKVLINQPESLINKGFRAFFMLDPHLVYTSKISTLEQGHFVSINIFTIEF